MLGGSDEEEEDEGDESPAEAAAATAGTLRLLPLSRSGSKGRARRREGAADGDDDAAAARAMKSDDADGDDAGDDGDNESHRAVVAERAPAVAAGPRPALARDPAFRPLPEQHGQECIVGIGVTERKRMKKKKLLPTSRRFVEQATPFSLHSSLALVVPIELWRAQE